MDDETKEQLEKPKKQKRSGLRRNTKIDKMAPAARDDFFAMLQDANNTYEYIAEEMLRKYGEKLSISMISRAYRRMLSQILEMQRQASMVETAIQIKQRNPDVDITEIGLAVMSSRLTQRITEADDDEIEDISLLDAGKLMAQLSRTRDYKKRLQADLEVRMRSAMEKWRDALVAEIGDKDPELLARLIAIAEDITSRETEM